MHSINKEVNPFYCNVRLIPNPELIYGAQFIEEGVCEYVIHKKGECVEYSEFFIPSKITDLDDSFDIKYKYSYFFIRDFLNITGVKEGILILLRNKPPSYEEILYPNLFFNRLR